MPRDVLSEAARLINGPRAKFYGKPTKNIALIATLWDAYTRAVWERKGRLDAYDVCQLMILLKVARGAHGYLRDSVLDTAGYAGLMEVLEAANAPKRKLRDLPRRKGARQ